MPESLPDDRLIDALRLSLVLGVGPRISYLLLQHFETPRGVLSTPAEELCRVDGVGPKIAAAIAAARTSDAAEQEMDRCRAAGVKLLTPDGDDYPSMLAEIHDPPRVLFCRGNIEPRDQLAVAIVGSRRCTHYGRQQAERLAGALGRAGVTIVSGLARGIDAAAHRGALQAGARTFAVLATGLNNIYPPEHVELAHEVAASGALFSESHVNQQPIPGLFPQRNRLISGLSLGVIVIEASRKSGALHTARHALEQGREVFAVPGRIDTPHSAGCHYLIRDGATILTSPDEVLEALGPLTKPVKTSDDSEVHSPRELSLNDQERLVLNLVKADPAHVDEILRSAELEPSRVLATLTVLEMKRLVRRLPGSNFCRC